MLDPILPKWQAFGWHCQEIDGHDMGQIVTAVENAKKEKFRPSMILANTVKGKGVPFIEGDNSWHKRTPTKEELVLALEALGGNA
jgi:transketolase